MCGIAGIISLNGQPLNNAESRIKSMTLLMDHRGPDSHGWYISPDKTVAIGNTRLAISDPQNNEHQPFETDDKKFILSFNGEIYNDLELRASLEKKVSHFKTRMDTETLLHGLIEEGEDFLHGVDGMWAFAFYDLKNKRLLLSRDVMGERQLFYTIRDDEFIFASEVGPLIQGSGHRFEFDVPNVLSSMRFGAASIGSTLMKGIHRLRAGYNILISPNDPPREYCHRLLHPEKWFDYFAQKPTLDQVITTFEDLFQKACMRRVPREVPFISTLSGGLDSALVCLYASDFGKKKMDTLFASNKLTPDQKLSSDLPEFTASQITANVVKSNHQVRPIDSVDVVDVLLRLASNAFDGLLDEGAASFEMLGWCGRKMSKKVMLISDGPDELCGGYTLDLKAYKDDLKNKSSEQDLLTGFKRPFHEIINRDILRQVSDSYDESNPPAAYGYIPNEYKDVAKNLDTTQIRALIYASTSIPDYCNLRTDKAFMRAAVESRSPFLAPAMVEFLIALPAAFRFGDGDVTKYLLRKIVEKYIGKDVAWRSKHGFSAPLWFDEGIQQKLQFTDVIQNSALWNLLPFNPNFKKNIFNAPFHKLRWSIFALTRTYESLHSTELINNF